MLFPSMQENSKAADPDLFGFPFIGDKLGGKTQEANWYLMVLGLEGQL